MLWASFAGSAEVRVRKGVERAVSRPGETNSYTIQATNVSAEPLMLHTIVDTLPPGFSYQTGTTLGATTSEPELVMLSCQAPAQQLAWKLDAPLEPGQSLTLSFGVTIAPEVANGTYTNSATATATRDEPECAAGPERGAGARHA